MLTEIKSALCDHFTWKITSDAPLQPEDAQFIAAFFPDIYHSDLDCVHWAYDTKLPSGLWLENMYFPNDLTSCTAEVLT
jgi:hypothetical protein